MGSHLVGFRIQNDRRRLAAFPSIEPGGSCETECSYPFGIWLILRWMLTAAVYIDSG